MVNEGRMPYILEENDPRVMNGKIINPGKPVDVPKAMLTGQIVRTTRPPQPVGSLSTDIYRFTFDGFDYTGLPDDALLLTTHGVAPVGLVKAICAEALLVLRPDDLREGTRDAVELALRSSVEI